jgi:NAD-dependent dihydropyrimidine dehydrogenase PreA subunit
MAMGPIPREKIPWFPTVDTDKCVGDQECVEFCKNEVFEWDAANGHPLVKNPYNCVVGCSACANICSSGAISFPSVEQIREVIRELREEMAKE